MLPKGSRLPYEEFRARGYRTAPTPLFLLKAKPNSTGKNRLGIIIGTSSIKSAARRNLWRRRVKTVFLSVSQKGFDLLVIFSPHTTLPSEKVFKKTLGAAITSLISRP